MNKLKADRIAKTYVKTGFNATETARQTKPFLKEKTEAYQRVAGHRMITNDNTQRALREILEEEGSLTNDEIQRLLYDNAKQRKSIQGSNTALDIALKVKGEYAPQQKLTLNITPDNITQLLREQAKQLNILLERDREKE